MQREIASRRGRLVLAVLSVIAALLAWVSVSFGDFSSRERSLEQSISSETGQISAYRGRLFDLRVRLAGLESSLAIQRALLARIRGELAATRARLVVLEEQLAHARALLAAQLVAQYESPTPDLLGVVLESRGFADLLERVDQMRVIARHNAAVVRQVARDKAQVAAQARRLTDAQARQSRVTAAVLIERDQVAGLRVAVLQRERVAVRDRARKQAELAQVRHQLAVLQARAAAAQRASFTVAAPDNGGAAITPGGQYGFFRRREPTTTPVKSRRSPRGWPHSAGHWGCI
jgi:peptidoglycan hydrolase CwlO-like protein